MLLEVKDLTLHFKVSEGWVHAVEDVNFTLDSGETLGLVGESGCGKTTLGYGITQLLPDNAHVKSGQVIFRGEDILTPSVKKNGTLDGYKPEMRDLRWKEISMIFQGAMNAFNPVQKVGDQIIEAIKVHEPGIPMSYPSRIPIQQIKLMELSRKIVTDGNPNLLESKSEDSIRNMTKESVMRSIITHATLVQSVRDAMIAKYPKWMGVDGTELSVANINQIAQKKILAEMGHDETVFGGAKNRESVATELSLMVHKYLKEPGTSLLGPKDTESKTVEYLANLVAKHPEGTAENRVINLYKLVGIPKDRIDNYPHEYSGGMRQRAMIAMALVHNPSLIIADEPTTALDVIMQRKILTEIENIQKKFSMAMVIITHDVSVVANVADKIAVMYAGRIMEYGSIRDVFKNSANPYTKALFGGFPNLKGERKKLASIPGNPPSLVEPPPGCRFHPRCKYAKEICQSEKPSVVTLPSGQQSLCHFAREVQEGGMV